ncbi:MAG: hypothetical protein PHF79_01055 [Candidatus Pacebacteria bacterium]|nr:hypothetical protein [Candidatus Paceibacterota bacterium]
MKNNFLTHVFSFSVGSILAFSPFLAFAQQSPDITSQIPEIQEQATVTVDPEIPKPNDSVSVSIEAFGIDLDRANVSWAVNGKTFTSGTGLKSLNLNAGPIGKVTKIDITVTPINGPAFTRSVTIAPADVDLIWEADSYTPPFYKGKALYSYQDNVRVVALPTLISNGSQVSRSNIIYNWKKNYTAYADKSGFGINYFDVTGNILTKPDNVAVEVSSAQDSSTKAANDVDLIPGDPQVALYEDNPLYGILFNRALQGSYNLNQAEVKVAAYPYFFGTNAKNGSTLGYAWSINNNSIDVPTNQNEVVFRQATKEKGQSDIAVQINSTDKLLEQAANAISFLIGK